MHGKDPDHRSSGPSACFAEIVFMWIIGPSLSELCPAELRGYHTAQANLKTRLGLLFLLGKRWRNNYLWKA